MKPLLSFSLAALLLSGCATAALPPKPTFTTPDAFSGKALAGTPAPAPTPPANAWWLVFEDPVLNRLVANAMTQNNDIRLADARLSQAMALLRSSRADFWPQGNAAYQVSHGANSAALNPGSVRPTTLHGLGLDLGYEVDLTGRLHAAASASALDETASSDLLKTTQLLIQSRVAETYFALRALDEDRSIVRQTLDAYRGTLDVTQKRYKEGDVAELDVARLQTEVEATESERAALDQQRAQLVHALSVLIGEPASAFDLETAHWANEPWASQVPTIPAGLPAEVIARRPDVRAAAATLEAAQTRVGIAKAAWLPQLKLTASGGFAASELDALFKDGAASWSLSGYLAQAVFDGGKRQAGVDYAKGGLGVAFASYQQSVLGALAEVEDQLSDLTYLRQQEASQDRAVAASNRALVLSQSRYTNGSASQLEVLDAQRQQLAVRRAALRVRAAQYLASVGLIRALGGGWTVS